MKPRQEAVEAPKEVLPGVSTAKPFAAAVARAFKSGHYKVVDLGGKHSTHSAIARDPESGRRYLLKPASGGVGPAAGVKEDPASQARRECGFSHVADEVFGLSNFVPEAEMVVLDGAEWAAIDMLPLDWKNLDKVRKQDPQRLRRIMESYRQQGILHRWAVMDYVLGNPDRHAGNLMVGPEDHVKLIDHGSAFAGPDFDPGNDKSSFIPYYLRYTVSTQNFNQMDPVNQMSRMPTVQEGVDAELRRWILGLDRERLVQALQHYGLRVDASVARLDLIQELDPRKAVHLQVNALWLKT